MQKKNNEGRQTLPEAVTYYKVSIIDFIVDANVHRKIHFTK